MGYRIINGRPYEIGQFPSSISSIPRKDKSEATEEVSFREILNRKYQKDDSFTISNHAAARLKEIELSEKDFEIIGKGIRLAAEKGCKNSVLLYKDIAFVTSIENKTIITAVQKEKSKENMFTNIDSVLFL